MVETPLRPACAAAARGPGLRAGSSAPIDSYIALHMMNDEYEAVVVGILLYLHSIGLTSLNFKDWIGLYSGVFAKNRRTREV